MEEIKKLPKQDFYCADAYTLACQLTSPTRYQNPEYDRPSPDQMEEILTQVHCEDIVIVRGTFEEACQQAWWSERILIVLCINSTKSLKEEFLFLRSQFWSAPSWWLPLIYVAQEPSERNEVHRKLEAKPASKIRSALCIPSGSSGVKVLQENLTEDNFEGSLREAKQKLEEFKEKRRQNRERSKLVDKQNKDYTKTKEVDKKKSRSVHIVEDEDEDVSLVSLVSIKRSNNTMEELKKLPKQDFYCADAYTLACQLTSPMLYQSPEYERPSPDRFDSTDGSKPTQIPASRDETISLIDKDAKK